MRDARQVAERQLPGRHGRWNQLSLSTAFADALQAGSASVQVGSNFQLPQKSNLQSRRKVTCNLRLQVKPWALQVKKLLTRL